MLQRIELKNFMSHRHTVIEPAAGLTVLVGPNNCGKSAVVAALQILCSNDTSTYVMRHGERECSVEIETSEGHIVRWTRKSSPSYRINGQLFDRLRNAGLPEELHQVLRLPPVDAGEGATFDIHFGCQKSPIFLLNDSPAAAAKFFASSSDAIRLVEMQRRHREKHQERQREKTRLEAESAQLTAELGALEPAADLDHRLRAAEESYQILGQLIAASEQLEAELSRIEGHATVAAYYEAQNAKLRSLTAPPEQLPVQPLVELSESLLAAANDLDRNSAFVAALSPLTSPPAMADSGHLQRLTLGLQEAARLEREGRAAQEALKRLTLPPLLSSIDPLADLCARLAENRAVVDWERRQLEVLRTLDAPPEAITTQPLESFIAKLQEAVNFVECARQRDAALRQLSPMPLPLATEPLQKLLAELEAAEAQTQALQVEAEAIEPQLLALAAEVRERALDSTCPTCGAPWDAERVLARAGGLGGHTHA